MDAHRCWGEISVPCSLGYPASRGQLSGVGFSWLKPSSTVWDAPVCLHYTQNLGWNDLKIDFPGWGTSWKHWSDIAAPKVKQQSGLSSCGYQRVLSKPICWKCFPQNSSNHGSNTKSYHVQLLISFLFIAFANPLTLPKPQWTTGKRLVIQGF